MATGISTALRTEIANQNRVFPVYEITLGGTTYKFAGEAIASESAGLYKPYVTHWGTISRSAGSIQSYSLNSPRVTVDILDEERVLQKLIGGPESGDIIDASTKTILRSFYVDAGDHYTLVDGLVSDYRLIHDRTWQFVSAPDDRALKAEINNIPKINEVDWPLAPDASYGTDGQIIYGTHTSSGISGATGLIPCTMVDEENNWWYVSIGMLEATSGVSNVWRNGVAATSDFTEETKLVNGTWYTIVRDTADTSTSSDDITVDASGVDSVGDGSGIVIVDPIRMLENFLANFVFGAWPTGSADGLSWLNRSTAPINTTHFDETSTFLTNRGHVCGKVLRTSDVPLTVFNEFCKGYKVHPFWAWDWKLAIRPYNHAPDTIYIAATHISQVKHKIVSAISSNTDSDKIVSKILGSYLYLDSTNNYAKSGVVEDPNRTKITESQNFGYGETVAF